MLPGLESLNELSKGNRPSNLDFVYYVFWDKGISLKEFNELPLPYIFKILDTHHYIKKQEEKEMKKAQRRK